MIRALYVYRTNFSAFYSTNSDKIFLANKKPPPPIKEETALWKHFFGKIKSLASPTKLEREKLLVGSLLPNLSGRHPCRWQLKFLTDSTTSKCSLHLEPCLVDSPRAAHLRLGFRSGLSQPALFGPHRQSKSQDRSRSLYRLIARLGRILAGEFPTILCRLGYDIRHLRKKNNCAAWTNGKVVRQFWTFIGIDLNDKI